MSTVRIAVLMTCHNRKEATLSCLHALMDQEIRGSVLKVYLVDAGSTDGTARAVQERFPDVHIILRDSNFYWCSGMRVAFAEAMKDNYDYYLWLNDDTMLLPNAICTLLRTARDVEHACRKAGIIVGSTRDPHTGHCTYGGVVRSSKWRPLRYRLVEPSERPQPCDTMNGNCVLIPLEVVRSVGNISPEFTHAIGDSDYGLRARAKGIPVWVAPNYVGKCSRNPMPSWLNSKIRLKERLENLHHPKGLPPGEWIVYARRHAGILWPLYWLTLHMRVIVPGFWSWLHK